MSNYRVNNVMLECPNCGMEELYIDLGGCSGDQTELECPGCEKEFVVVCGGPPRFLAFKTKGAKP